MRRTAAVGVIVVATLVVGLVLPGAAGAQRQTLGNPLTSSANAGFGCEIQPRILDSSGTWYATFSNVPDCTWWNTGGGTVPGDGIVEKVTIKSGPNPARIRFVVLRTLASPGPGSFCCFFVAETSAVKPARNARQSFIVNLPVERNTNPNGIVTQDTIGFSAVSNTGTLPLHDYGRHNALDPINPATNASWLYPRMSSASDTGSGRRPDGSSNGWEVLLQTTFCPAGQNCNAAGGGGSVPNAVPVVGQPAFFPRVFRVGPGPTAVTAAAKRGAELRFNLSEVSTATIKIQRSAKGKRKGKKCVKPGKKRRKAKACRRWSTVKTLTRSNLPAGDAVVPFSGRIGKKKLKPGRYRALITARDAAGAASGEAAAAFRIVR